MRQRELLAEARSGSRERKDRRIQDKTAGWWWWALVETRHEIVTERSGAVKGEARWGVSEMEAPPGTSCCERTVANRE
ncbi:hypothetical protein VZT92_027183 [Zoarces viviparus]|uniref:Uncharacterized protein n=1 Tax=Zoarces viviparus TaxID=48416 RepID=A0AAW1DU62_ZOAVI